MLSFQAEQKSRQSQPSAAVPRPHANNNVPPKEAPIIDLLGMDNSVPQPVTQQPAVAQSSSDDFELFMQAPSFSSPPQSQVRMDSYLCIPVLLLSPIVALHVGNDSIGSVFKILKPSADEQLLSLKHRNICFCKNVQKSNFCVSKHKNICFWNTRTRKSFAFDHLTLR